MVPMDRRVTKRQDSVLVDQHLKDYVVTDVNLITTTTLSVKVCLSDLLTEQQRNKVGSTL